MDGWIGIYAIERVGEEESLVGICTVDGWMNGWMEMRRRMQAAATTTDSE